MAQLSYFGLAVSACGSSIACTSRIILSVQVSPPGRPSVLLLMYTNVVLVESSGFSELFVGV